MDRLDRVPEGLAALPVEGAAAGIEPGERLDRHVDGPQRTDGIGPEVRVDHRLFPDHSARRQDRIHQRPDLEDARLARSGRARDALGPRVEPQADGEDETGVGEADDVAWTRLVVVRVETGLEDELHLQTVARDALGNVVEWEHRGGDLPLGTRRTVAGDTEGEQDEHERDMTAERLQPYAHVGDPPLKARIIALVRSCLGGAGAPS